MIIIFITTIIIIIIEHKYITHGSTSFRIFDGLGVVRVDTRDTTFSDT